MIILKRKTDYQNCNLRNEIMVESCTNETSKKKFGCKNDKIFCILRTFFLRRSVEAARRIHFLTSLSLVFIRVWLASESDLQRFTFVTIR